MVLSTYIWLIFYGFHAGKYTIYGCGNGYDGMDPNAALGSFRWKLVGGGSIPGLSLDVPGS